MSVARLKKMSLIGPAARKAETLEALQALGCMHVMEEGDKVNDGSIHAMSFGSFRRRGGVATASTLAFSRSSRRVRGLLDPTRALAGGGETVPRRN